MPKVSIILPTYNRERFLPEAFGSIRAQTFTDWELIVVDDGSTDRTAEVIAELTPTMAGPVRYIQQTNGGPGKARATGIDAATSEYLAFYDSDDLWLPHHLADGVAALDANPELSWVFSAGRRINTLTGAVITENSFYRNGKLQPFLALQHRVSGPVRILTDPTLLDFMLSKGRQGGLQTSLFRRSAFDRVAMPTFRVGEDYALAVQFVAAGLVMGYLDDVHVVYRIHDDQISAAGGGDVDKLARVQREHLRALESLMAIPSLTANQRKLLRLRLANDFAWKLGYATFAKGGKPREARQAYIAALKYAPLSPRVWKAYLQSFCNASGSVPETKG